MGKIVVSSNVSLDGVVQDPDGEEGYSFGGWFGRSGGKDLVEWQKVQLAEALAAQALLLGRRSDTWFATRWSERTGAWADRLSALPKYVVSATVEKPAWGNGVVLSGDPVQEVAKLAKAVDGDIVVYGSIQLVHALFEHDLVDELRLYVFPVVVGAGERLFPESWSSKPMRLAASQTVGDSLTSLTYRPVREN
ncbi:dihydrofolate reductase family protein [Actinospica robiniae]|uniref:dihydrofolate reductase family protein n=1 Tax=Actinospica robiniae TaxID=304901 RepID=UPI00054DF001|nr:dihydrofolate reductase family protein [Actinospica robiniae]